MTAKTWLSPPVGFQKDATTTTVVAWVENFRQAMLDIGLIQTNDSGQFDKNTFSYVSVAREQTYLMFAFDDPLQETYPIYIRIGINSYTKVDDGMCVGSSIAVGSKTDGNGEITKDTIAFSRNIAHYYGGVTQGYSNQSYASFSKDKGFVGVVFNAGRMNFPNTIHYYSPISFFVERIPEFDGTPGSKGFTVWGCDQTGVQGGGYNMTQNFDFVNVLTSWTKIFDGPLFSGNDSIPFYQSSMFLMPEVFAMHAFHTTPLPVRANGIVAIPTGRLTKGAEFDLNVYGVDEANFVATNFESALRPCSASVSAVLAFLFE